MRSGDRTADSVILFGATGDLAAKKLFPALYELHRTGEFRGPLVAVGRSDLSDDGIRARAADSVRAATTEVDEAGLASFTASVRYVRGSYDDAATYEQIRAALGPACHPLAFLAIPPDAFDDVVAHLAAAGFNNPGRVIVEKPFGQDLASAQRLNAVLHEHFAEDDIYRIDHFLGKEPVQNVLIVRFANSVFEPLWNRHHVDRVQILMAEDFGVEQRGAFYDGVGAMRDVLQNHLLQLACLLAMEPPASRDPQALRDEVVKVLHSIRTLGPDDVVRGQYRGYRDIDGVAPDSDTETFFAVRLWVDSWRWADVPFVIRAGKRMAQTVTEAIVEFASPPRLMFSDRTDRPPHANHLRFRIKPDDTVSLYLQTKVPGDALVGEGQELEVSSSKSFGEGPEAYERLIGDAIAGDPRLFARQDAVEEAWRIVDAVLADPPPVLEYEPGSWGPEAADELIGREPARRTRR